MGGGGQWLLRGVPHALRTRIVAPFAERVTRLTATLSAEGRERVTPKTVAPFIRRDDIQKSARMRYLFDVDLKDPGLYDVHINTAVLSRAAAVQLLADLARQPDFATTDAGRQLVADRALASQVEVALAGHPDLRRRAINVESRQGNVTLELSSGADPDVARSVAQSVPGAESAWLRAGRESRASRCGPRRSPSSPRSRSSGRTAVFRSTRRVAGEDSMRGVSWALAWRGLRAAR